MTEASSYLWPLLTSVVGAGGWAIGTRLKYAGVLSPYSMIVAILTAIFGIRPLLMLETDTYDFYGKDIRDGFQLASIIGFVAVFTLVTTFSFIRVLRGKPEDGPTRTSRESNSEDVCSTGTIRASFFFSFSLLALWLILTLQRGGGLDYLQLLAAGRSSEATASMAGVPAVVPALPVVAVLLAACMRFRTEQRIRYDTTSNVLYWVLLALCLVPPSLMGNRRFLIPCLLAGLIGATASIWHERVKLRIWAIAIVSFVVLAIVPFVRSAGSRQQSKDLTGAIFDYFTTEGLRGVLEGFFLSYDTEMFNWVAYFAPRVGESIPFGLGRATVGEAMLAPIPAAFAPYESWSNQLLIYAFGGPCGASYCPVPSVAGTLYADLGFAGVILGMVVIAILCSYFNPIRSAYSWRLVVSLALASFAPVIARGNPISQLWIAAQSAAIVLLLLAILHALSKRRRQAPNYVETMNRREGQPKNNQVP